MKKFLLKTFLLLLTLIVGGANSAWADSYTITFATGSGDGTSASTSTACNAVASAGASYLSGNLVTATKVYYGGSNGLKLGTSSAAGVIKMNLASNVTPTSIVVNAKLYNSSKAATLKVNGSTAQSITSSFSDLTFDITSEISYIQLDVSKYSWIKSITVNYSSTSTSTAPTIDDGEAASNFTISKDVAITAADGATIYYTTDGTDPTTSSSTYSSAIHITSTTTIKAAALEDGKALSSVSSKTFTKVLADNTITVTGGTTPSVDRTGGSAVDDWTPTASATSGGTISYAVKSTTNLTQGTDFTFNTTTGKVSFLTAYKGTIIITASVAADENYADASQDITLTVNGNKRTPVIDYDGEDTEISSSGSLVINPESIETDGTITITSSDTDVATVSEYTISAVSDGTTTITISTTDGTYYEAGSGSFELTVVTPSACDIALTGAPVSKTFDVYNNATPQVITYTTSSTGAVSIASSPYATFTIDQENKTITVTPKSKTPSAQTITINQAAAGRYLAGSTTFSLTVNNSATSETYEKVTSTANLSEGDVVTFVNEGDGKALGAFRSENHNFGAAAVSISDNSFSLTANQTAVTLLTLEATTATVSAQTVDAWYFNTGSAYLYAYSSGSNQMEAGTKVSAGENGKATISFSSGDAVVTFRGDKTRNIVRFNSSNSPRLFSCYSSGQDAIQLYKRAKYANKITVTNGAAQTLELEDEQDLTLSATSYCGAVSFEYKSATNLIKDTDFTFDPATGELHVDENAVSGTITITANTVESATHKAASTDIVITVVGKPADPDFTGLSDQEKLAEETYTLVNGVDFVTDGDVTLSSSNTNVATVAGLVVTAVAVGEATITVSAAKGTLYKSGSDTFTFTVTAPDGKTTVSDVVAFSEDFSSLTASGPGSDFNSRGGELTSFGSWTIGKAYQSGSCVSLGTGSVLGDITTPSFTVVSGKTYHLTFKAAPWNTEDDTSMKVTVTGGTIDSKSSATSSSLATKKWTTIEYDIVASSTSMTLNFQAGTNYRVWLDDISVTTPSTATVSLNANGYATYCSVNPMDFSNAEGYTAWYIESITSAGVITFHKITGKIKGGQGVLLYDKSGSNANKDVTVKFASNSNELSGNKLVGTTAPTYVAEGTAYGLKADKFVINNAPGNINANRAYIPSNEVPNEVKSFTLVFEDTATGITETRKATREEVEGIFNLAGQRISRTRKGINIVNGKKVVIK